MSRWCKECGQGIMGRSDKVFCDDACRSLYHNRRLSLERKNLYGIDSILRRNRKILQELSNGKRRILSKEELRRKGFHFSYFTHRRSIQDQWVNFCYDLGYLEKEDDLFEIFCDQETILAPK